MGIVDVLIRDSQSINPKATFFISLNVVSSISIVLMNKYVYQYLGFKHGTTLTFIHFVMTFAGLGLLCVLGLFPYKKLPVFRVVWLSLSFCGFVVFTNLSLQYNSVGFYQIMKVMTTPTVVIINSLLYWTHVSERIKLSLIPIILGVIITTVSDVSINVIGTIYAVLGVIVTSFYQIWVGRKQKELQCNSQQLLLYQSSISAVMLLYVIPLLDDISKYSNTSLFNYEYTLWSIFCIILTGFLAILVNLSIYLVIGKTSALTYNIAGHFKTLTLFCSSFFLFGQKISVLNILGIIIAFGGIIWYTHLKLDEQAQEKEKLPEKDVRKGNNGTGDVDEDVDEDEGKGSEEDEELGRDIKQ